MFQYMSPILETMPTIHFVQALMQVLELKAWNAHQDHSQAQRGAHRLDHPQV